MRILSWNIERGYRVNDVARFAREFEADICLFQEVDRDARRTGFLNIANALAGHLSCNYALGIAFRELQQGPNALQGQAILSRFSIRNPRILRFRNQSEFWKPRWFVPNTPPFQERLGGRIALVAEFDPGGGGRERIVAYNLHLESRGPESLRAAQLREVLSDAERAVATRNTTVIIAGDMNTKAGPRSPCVELLRQAGFHDAVGRPDLYTTNRGGPFAGLFLDGAIDWIWVRGPLAVTHAEVHTWLRVSDHFPLTALLA